MANRKVFGAVEGGGTKFVCMLGTSPNDIIDEITLPTTEPIETLGGVIEFLARPRLGIELAAIGVATFGPIGLDRSAPGYGGTLEVTKPGWSNVRIVAPLARRFGVPIGFDTDVNGAVLGESRWGAAQGVDPALYLTIGTGIGGGALINGATIQGALHPEMGHVPVPRVAGDTFEGICIFHGGNCLEGVASGPAIAARAGRPAGEIPSDDPIWGLTATYLAYGLSAYVLTLSPRRIVLGGGVMHQKHLLPRVRVELARILNGYLRVPELEDRIDAYVVPSGLGQRAGLFGALVLAERAVG